MSEYLTHIGVKQVFDSGRHNPDGFHERRYEENQTYVYMVFSKW